MPWKVETLPGSLGGLGNKHPPMSQSLEHRNHFIPAASGGQRNLCCLRPFRSSPAHLVLPDCCSPILPGRCLGWGVSAVFPLTSSSLLIRRSADFESFPLGSEPAVLPVRSAPGARAAARRRRGHCCWLLAPGKTSWQKPSSRRRAPPSLGPCPVPHISAPWPVTFQEDPCFSVHSFPCCIIHVGLYRCSGKLGSPRI